MRWRALSDSCSWLIIPTAFDRISPALRATRAGDACSSALLCSKRLQLISLECAIAQHVLLAVGNARECSAASQCVHFCMQCSSRFAEVSWNLVQPAKPNSQLCLLLNAMRMFRSTYPIQCHGFQMPCWTGSTRNTGCCKMK